MSHASTDSTAAESSVSNCFEMDREAQSNGGLVEVVQSVFGLKRGVPYEEVIKNGSKGYTER